MFNPIHWKKPEHFLLHRIYWLNKLIVLSLYKRNCDYKADSAWCQKQNPCTGPFFSAFDFVDNFFGHIYNRMFSSCASWVSPFWFLALFSFFPISMPVSFLYPCFMIIIRQISQIVYQISFPWVKNGVKILLHHWINGCSAGFCPEFFLAFLPGICYSKKDSSKKRLDGK